MSNLIGYIQRVKAATTLPVTTADAWNIWDQDASSNLAAAVDFIMIHVHPYWESPYWNPKLTAETAAQHVIDRYNQIRQKYPAKRVVIGETGWPTAGSVNGGAVPGDANQQRFLQDLSSIARTSAVEILWFEAFDEAWKSAEGDVGAHWGFCLTNRVCKPAISNLLASDSRVIAITAATGSVCVTVGSYPGNQYTLEASTNLLVAAWPPLVTFTGAPAVNVSAVTVDASAAAARFCRNRLNLP